MILWIVFAILLIIGLIALFQIPSQRAIPVFMIGIIGAFLMLPWCIAHQYNEAALKEAAYEKAHPCIATSPEQFYHPATPLYTYMMIGKVLTPIYSGETPAYYTYETVCIQRK